MLKRARLIENGSEKSPAVIELANASIALSPTGYYGKQVLEKAEYLLNNDFYTFTGTDIHNLESHRQAFNQKSLTSKLTDKINALIENNCRLFFRVIS
ncbi:MAG: hypothetical protein LBC19_09015 [Tannerella sp.]|nr:hypothetical protein [Tannerella sp.]